MDKRMKWIAGGSLALAALGTGTGLAIASSGDDDQPLTGSALDKATAAALDHTGGGRVVESEAGDGGAAYEVGIRLEDGSVVEVVLDREFHVIGTEADGEGTAEEDGDGAADRDAEGT